MNLIAQRGWRSMYSWAEVCECLAMPRRRVQHLVTKGVLVKATSGAYPFAQSDINEFLTKFNSGRIRIGVRGGGRKANKEGK